MQQQLKKRVAQSGPARLLQWDRLALVQGVYYLMTGLWPLIHIKSFLKVTGPKTDLWLVKTVGVLISVIGAVLGSVGVQRSANQQTALLAAGSAAGLAGIDVVYVVKRRISPIYLLDAVPELLLVGGWLLGRRHGTQVLAEPGTE